MRNGYFIITEVEQMKKRIKHLSKSTVSVILTLCMLVSCVTVGLIATDAAQLTGENRVGAAAPEDSSVAASVGDTTIRTHFEYTFFAVPDAWLDVITANSYKVYLALIQSSVNN